MSVMFYRWSMKKNISIDTKVDKATNKSNRFSSHRFYDNKRKVKGSKWERSQEEPKLKPTITITIRGISDLVVEILV